MAIEKRRCARTLNVKSRSPKNSLRLGCERLEERLVMYSLSGYSWSGATASTLSYSFAPDGTSTQGYTSSLFSELDGTASRDVWQREFARALQSWADVSNINLHQVADSGVASGSTGTQGDIRFAAHPLSAGYLAYTYYPGSGLGGDLFLATDYTFHAGADYDLYSVALHELGHALGLAHSSTSGSVMSPSYQGILSGLTADDIAGIQALYGVRTADSFDAIASNDSLARATVLTIDSSGAKTLSADLTSLSDVDYYRITSPTSFDGTLHVTLDARGVSLLQPRVLVYDGSGTLIGSADATVYGDKAEVNLSGLSAGQTYYVVADGATSDVFGMGKYSLSMAFGGVVAPVQPPPAAPTISADRFESDNTLATAANLGKTNSVNQTGLTLNSATDKDYYKFTPKTNGTFSLTTTFASTAGQHEIKLFNSSKVQIGSINGTSLTASLTGGKQYFVLVDSPSGTLDTYNFSIQTATGGALKGGALRGDGEAVDAEAAAREDHDSDWAAAVDSVFNSWRPEQQLSNRISSPLLGNSGGTSLLTVNSSLAGAKQSDRTLSSDAVSAIFERVGETRPDETASANLDWLWAASESSN